MFSAWRPNLTGGCYKTRTSHLKHRYQQAASDAFSAVMVAEITLTFQEEELLR